MSWDKKYSDEKLHELYTRVEQNDDEDAFKIIFESLHESLYIWSFSFVKSKTISEDIIIEVFSKLWERRNVYKVNNLVPFMYKSVKNIALNHLSSLRNRSKHISINDIEFSIESYQYSPEYKYISQEDVDVINQIIEQLPTEQKIVICMIREHQRTHKEVAEIMGVSTRSVDRYVNRAISNISKVLEMENQRVLNSKLIKSFIFLCPL